jgi:hypothetical protein
MSIKSNPKSRRGVGGIIAGVLLMGVLLTSAFVYFVTIANNDKTKAGYELRASQADSDKETEGFVVSRNYAISGGNLNIMVNNTGPIPMVVSHWLLYCVSGSGCSNPLVPVAKSDPPLSLTLNAGESSPAQTVGPVTSGNTYRIDVISQRGNIVSAGLCTVEGNPPVCKSEGGGFTEEQGKQVEGKVNEGIIQGTGSIQLDYKAFGAIFPKLASRGNVDQSGWDVVTASSYGNATGYPAFEIPYQLDTVFVEKFRNLDPSNDTIILSRGTSLLTNIGKEQSNQQDVEFICKENKATKTLTGYKEDTANKIIPAVAMDANRTTGWQEIYFCSQTPGQASNDYQPRNQFNSFHPLFMVVRGEFQNSHAQYGQTIPYQSAMPGGTAASSFNACIRPPNGSGPVSNSPCPNPTTADNSSNMQYSATRTAMQNGVKIWIHVNTVTSPVTVTWIYPNGNHTILATNKILDGNKNIPNAITLPTTNADGTPISCRGGLGAHEYYIIKVTDQYDTNGLRNVYYMTWRMDC